MDKIRLAVTLLAATLIVVTTVRAQPSTLSSKGVLIGVLEKMRAEKRTPQQLWEQGLLDQSLIMLALEEEEILDRGAGLWTLGPEGRGFVQLLLEHFPEVLEPSFKANTILRIRVAQYVMYQEDPRGVTVPRGGPMPRGAIMLEEIIAQMPREGAHLPTINTLLTLLSQHYWKFNKGVEARETPYKIREFTQEPEVSTQVFLQAASTAYMADDPKTGKQLHQEVHTYNYGRGSALAIVADARRLFREGKLKEGRALLKTPFEGLAAEEYHIILHGELAASYLTTQEWEAARQYAGTAINLYNNMVEPLQLQQLQQDLEFRVKKAQTVLDAIARYEQEERDRKAEFITRQQKNKTLSSEPAFDIPFLLGLDIQQIEALLGPPTGGGKSWSVEERVNSGDSVHMKTWENERASLKVNYYPWTWEVRYIALHLNRADHDIPADNKKYLLSLANLKEEEDSYLVMFDVAADKASDKSSFKYSSFRVYRIAPSSQQ